MTTVEEDHEVAVAGVTGRLPAFGLRSVTTLAVPRTIGSSVAFVGLTSRVEVESVSEDRGRSYVLVGTTESKRTGTRKTTFLAPTSSASDEERGTWNEGASALRKLEFPASGTVSNASVLLLTEGLDAIPTHLANEVRRLAPDDDVVAGALRYPLLATVRGVGGALAVVADLAAGVPLEWVLRRFGAPS